MANFTYFTKPDLSRNLRPFCNIQKIHNTILIPEQNHNYINNLTKSQKITVVNKKYNKKLEQSIVLDKGYINYFNNKYFYIYIAPGLRIQNHILEKDDYHLYYDNQVLNLSLIFNPKNEAKLLNGLLVLDNNYFYNFNINDNIETYINQTKYMALLKNIHNKYNFYSPSMYTTILDIMQESNSDLLYGINNDKYYLDQFLVRSITKSLYKEKGSIIINNLSNLHTKYHVECINLVSKELKTFIMDKNILSIKDIGAGSYNIIIKDYSKKERVFQFNTSVQYFIDN